MALVIRASTPTLCSGRQETKIIAVTAAKWPTRNIKWVYMDRKEDVYSNRDALRSQVATCQRCSSTPTSFGCSVCMMYRKMTARNAWSYPDHPACANERQMMLSHANPADSHNHTHARDNTASYFLDLLEPRGDDSAMVEVLHGACMCAGSCVAKTQLPARRAASAPC
jgi:hypothetical protein